ncbi:hypothetical protein DL765_010341 [Monosporascus sp. GIB2]|nr:hypothetical protein DL765_010341 [Monosporascus sp. GIB2]
MRSLGRGATKHHSSVASTAQGLSSRPDGSHIDPPSDLLPTLQPQGNSTDKTTQSHLFYDPPPSSKLPPTATTPLYSNKAELNNLRPDLAETAAAEEPPGPSSIRSVEGQPPALELSRQIYIVGFRNKARFIAHSLAPIPQIPPVRILAHHRSEASAKWLEEGKAIDLHDARGKLLSSHPIHCPEHIGPRVGAPGFSRWDGGFLDNIVVDTGIAALHPTLRALRHSIDNRTTICLIQEGLGVIEKLNEEIFDDPAVRPTYILGHMTHHLARHMGTSMALRHKGNNGQLLLSAVPREEDHGLEVAVRDHFIGLLSTSEALHPVGLSWIKFLHRKLPGMIWSSLVDSISVILGCRYDQIVKDSHARRLWYALLDETLYIVSSLPEFRDKPNLLKYFTRDEFRMHLKQRLERQGPMYSEWISLIRRGDITPVNFINGYFVRRAQELGLDHRVNSLVVSMVKARHQARIRELDADIPFGLKPYMMDGDKLGGQINEDDSDFDL